MHESAQIVESVTSLSLSQWLYASGTHCLLTSDQVLIIDTSKLISSNTPYSRAPPSPPLHTHCE